MTETLFPSAWPEILYWGRGGQNLTPEHIHPFFQLEIGIAGVLRGTDRHGVFTIGPGECRLFAPEEPHSFHGNGGALDYASLKFRFPKFPFTLRNDRITAELLRRIVALLPAGPLPPGQDAERLHLLAGELYLLLLELHRDTPPAADTPPALLRRINAEVLQQGYRLNVNLLADKLGLSLSQLKYRFHLENNTASPHLKDYIDSLLTFAARRHLEYSALRPGEIASLLKFPDVYTFSRFFKRRTGMTPSEFRRQHTAAPNSGTP